MIGPKKQDIAEIKARAISARAKSKYGESIERINLAYSRIISQCDSSIITEEEEKAKDIQFKVLVELNKDFESNQHGTSSDITNSYATPLKSKDTFDLTLSATRFIFLRRQKNSIWNKFQNPYEKIGQSDKWL